MQNKAKLSLPITNHYLIFKNWRAGPNSIGYQISGRYNRTTVLKYWRVIWFCDRSAWTSCYAPYYLWSGGATGQLEPGVQPRTTCDLVVRPVSLNQVSSPVLPVILWCVRPAWTRCPAPYSGSPKKAQRLLLDQLLRERYDVVWWWTAVNLKNIITLLKQVFNITSRYLQ